MNRNLLKELHEDLRTIIIDKYVNKYHLSISKILIEHDKTTINYNIVNNDKIEERESIELDNNLWNRSEV